MLRTQSCKLPRREYAQDFLPDKEKQLQRRRIIGRSRQFWRSSASDHITCLIFAVGAAVGNSLSMSSYRKNFSPTARKWMRHLFPLSIGGSYIIYCVRDRFAFHYEKKQEILDAKAFGLKEDAEQALLNKDAPKWSKVAYIYLSIEMVAENALRTKKDQLSRRHDDIFLLSLSINVARG